jgi:hypothetical protein
MSKLLIQASDIPILGFTQKSADPVNQSGATGITAAFANADGSREVGDTIVVFPDERTVRTD